jgi:hypothetical protein
MSCTPTGPVAGFLYDEIRDYHGSSKHGVLMVPHAVTRCPEKHFLGLSSMYTKHETAIDLRFSLR